MDNELNNPLINHAEAVIKARDAFSEALAQANTVFKAALREAHKAYREQVKSAKGSKDTQTGQ